MKCPKCGYLGFEHVERCRNCGYDFSLTSAGVTPELPIRRDPASEHPLDDLSLVDATIAANAARPGATPDLDGLGPTATAPPASATPGELPLFGMSGTSARSGTSGTSGTSIAAGTPIPDDQPLITKASPPRPPLAVRRKTPEVRRMRVEAPRPASLDLTMDTEPGTPARGPLDPAPRARADFWSRAEADNTSEDATVGARFVAVVIDLLILAVIDAIVIYFTMQICGITFGEIGMLPKAPLLAFLFVQNGGYLVAFTAGGQTLGKMAAGIRVVAADSESTLDVGRACLRTLMWFLLAVPVGLGFLTALFSRDHRGLHDRFAGTRVVR
jgi:uncharacterized RDD family membrane protein YckC